MTEQAPGSLLSVLDVEPQGHDVFIGEAAGGMQHLYGGHLLGQSVTAVSRTVPDRPIHSLHGYFLVAGDGREPVRYEVTRTRDGGTFSSRRVAGYQGDRLIWIAQASFHGGAEGFERVEPVRSAPSPHDWPSFMEGMSEMGTITAWNDFDLRWGGPWPPTGTAPEGTPPHNQVWIRSKIEVADPVLNAAALAYISDFTFLTPVLLPHGAYMWTPGLLVTSLDHAIWFHRPFSVNDWLLYDQESPIASAGRGMALGTISTPDGVRVATTAQEGLVRIQPSASLR